MARAGDGDVIFLHRLKQRRLGARAGAVDLVGHQKLSEDRARDEAEGALAEFVLFHHLGAEYVRRHQVRRKLNAAGIEAEHNAERLDQLGLGETRHADQQGVAAGEKRDQRALDHALLAEDDTPDAVSNSRNVSERLLGLRDHVLFADYGFLDHHTHAASILVCWDGRQEIFQRGPDFAHWRRHLVQLKSHD